jgi:hypothetical protein
MRQSLAPPPPPAPRESLPAVAQRRVAYLAHFFVVATLGLSFSCEKQSKPPRKKAPVKVLPSSSTDSAARANIGALLKRDERREHDEPPESPTSKKGHPKQPFILDELVDVAPAGPAAAAVEGVVLVTKTDTVQLAPLGGNSTSLRPVVTPVASIDADPKAYVPRARGPAVVRHAVYWVSGSRLLRQAIAGGTIEVLATDARAYTQIAGPGEIEESLPAAVGYISVRPNNPSALVAKLWVEGSGSQELSPEGTTANTVALARRGNDWWALYLEARTGMSPLHARSFNFGPGGIKLGADSIVWVAGSAQPMTFVHGIGDAEHAWALLPIERDISRFGLARIPISGAAEAEPEVAWRDYPNGMDPAPVSTAVICGKPMVLYSRPSSAAPHAPQELHMAAVDAAGLGPSTLVGSSRGYSDVSVTALNNGALVVFVADHRTWTRRLRCTH